MAKQRHRQKRDKHGATVSPKRAARNQDVDAAAADSEARRPAEQDDETALLVGGSSGIAVLGLGGSAGSLKSFEDFFAAMPANSGAAFVVIQHLAPAHASLLPELVTQYTQMKVVQAQDAVPVEPNCVYVIPPNQYLGIRDGVLYLAEPVKRDGIRMPIDYFFRSLAEDRQQRAIGILFSGAGSDGTLGVRAIRGGGGLAIVQDPQTAQFDTMPRSAIATGLVDYVLSPDRMPEALLEYLRHPYVQGGEPADVLEANEKPEGVQNILAVVLAQTGCDFRCYKKSTILRRIQRRMGLHRISDVAQYSGLLFQDAHEVNQLLKDLLINVTSFFRDPEAFEELRHKAIRPLVETRQADAPLRVWVPGCASGEEAYSLAILLIEEVLAAGKDCTVQVFATDIDEESLKSARLGTYPESIVADVEADRLSKFFVRKESGYQISDALRKSVVFAAQNLLADPPFSKMDIISCRNLLIYLDADTQSKLMPLMNFALNAGGYLFLGKSEGIGGRNDLFDTISKKGRLYRRLTPARPIVLDSPIRPGRKRTISTAMPAARPAASGLTDAIRQALLDQFSASVVLVDRKGQILQFHGQTGKYLNMPAGEPELSLLELAKPGLALKLRSAIHKATEGGKTVVLKSVPVTRSKGGPFVRVTVAPVAQRGETEPLLAVIFEDVPRPAIAGVELAQPGQGETVVMQLEDELKVARHDHQTTIDDLQASNEELRVANEEVTSSNEELQSTNEELETSKEELQSVNEELTTVNSQLQEKVHQLDTANSDMANLLKSSEIATLFLDSELRIKFFTPAMTRVLNLIAADIGRPLTHLSTALIGCDLTADARSVIQGASVAEKEVQHADGSFYLMRAVPYRTQMERADGVVVTFVDVTNLRKAERQFADIVESSADAIFAKTLEGTVLTWNRAAEAIYGYPAAEAIGRNVSMLVPPDRMSELATLVERIKRGESIVAFDTERVRKDGRKIPVSLSLSPMRDASGQIVGISTVAQDTSERKRAEEEKARLASFPILNPNPIVEVDVDGRVSFANPAAQRLFPDLEQLGSDHPWLADATLLVGAGREDASVGAREVTVGQRCYHQSLSYISEARRIRIYGTNITERHREQQERETTVEFLRRVNESTGTRDLVRAAATFFQQQSDCEAVGIRLKEGDDYPYFEARGFPAEFVLVENSLCSRDSAGAVVRDSSGNAVIECMCGNVICGRFDPSKPFFTAGGSFWTNSTTELLASTTEADRQSRTRNRCNGEGYESVALLPLSIGAECLGLLQLNDRRKDRFSPAMIGFWERLTGYLAIALAKFRAEDEVRQLNATLEDRVAQQTGEIRKAGVYNRILLEASLDPLVTIGPDGKITDVNTATEQATGFGRRDLVGTDFAAYFTEPEKAQSGYRRVFQDGMVRDYPLEIRHRDGHTIPVLYNASVYRDENGKVVGVFAAARDITERKLAEDAVQKERRRLSDVLNMLPVYAILLAPDYHVPFANRFFEERFGKSDGRRCYEYLFGRNEPCETCETYTVLKTGVPHRWEWTGPDGRNYDIYDFPFADSDGSPMIMEVGVDITERKQAEAALKEANQTLERRVAERTAELARERGNLQAVFDVVNVGMLVIDEHGAVRRVNDTVSRWVGRDASTYSDDQPGDVIHCVHALNNPEGCGRSPECGSCLIRKAFESVLRFGEPVHDIEALATLSIDKNEFPVWLEVSADPLVLNGTRHVILAMNNITARKQAEEALRRVADELARSNHDLQQFTAVASHDLQEPLRTVAGFVQLLEKEYRGRLDANADTYIGYTVDGVKRMQTLISDLLAYARVGTRGRELVPTDAGALLRQALGNLQASIEETAAQITHGELPTVRADPSQLAQLFQNLLGNAIKFRGQAPPKIHVDACRDGDHWQISVRDNGIGIEPKSQDRIFEMFRRLHPRQQYAGTGIGLAICKRIVERHGGQIWVESQPGNGATFHFTLPK